MIEFDYKNDMKIRQIIKNKFPLQTGHRLILCAIKKENLLKKKKY